MSSVPGSTCGPPPPVGVAGAAVPAGAGVVGVVPDAATGLCFFGLGVPEPGAPPGVAEAPPSSALRFFELNGVPPGVVGEIGTGLVARLASGLAARLPI